MAGVSISPRIASHPAYLVASHLPTVLWLGSSLLDLLALATGSNRLVRLAYRAQWLGIGITSLLRIVQVAEEEPVSEAAADLQQRQAWLLQLLLGVYTLSTRLRAGEALARSRPAPAPLLLSLAGVAGLFVFRSLVQERARLSATRDGGRTVH